MASLLYFWSSLFLSISSADPLSDIQAILKVSPINLAELNQHPQVLEAYLEGLKPIQRKNIEEKISDQIIEDLFTAPDKIFGHNPKICTSYFVNCRYFNENDFLKKFLKIPIKKRAAILDGWKLQLQNLYESSDFFAHYDFTAFDAIRVIESHHANEIKKDLAKIYESNSLFKSLSVSQIFNSLEKMGFDFALAFKPDRKILQKLRSLVESSLWSNLGGQKNEIGVAIYLYLKEAYPDDFDLKNRWAFTQGVLYSEMVEDNLSLQEKFLVQHTIALFLKNPLRADGKDGTRTLIHRTLLDPSAKIPDGTLVVDPKLIEQHTPPESPYRGFQIAQQVSDTTTGKTLKNLTAVESKALASYLIWHTSSSRGLNLMKQKTVDLLLSEEAWDLFFRTTSQLGEKLLLNFVKHPMRDPKLKIFLLVKGAHAIAKHRLESETLKRSLDYLSQILSFMDPEKAFDRFERGRIHQFFTELRSVAIHQHKNIPSIQDACEKWKDQFADRYQIKENINLEERFILDLLYEPELFLHWIRPQDLEEVSWNLSQKQYIQDAIVREFGYLKPESQEAVLSRWKNLIQNEYRTGQRFFQPFLTRALKLVNDHRSFSIRKEIAAVLEQKYPNDFLKLKLLLFPPTQPFSYVSLLSELRERRVINLKTANFEAPELYPLLRNLAEATVLSNFSFVSSMTRFDTVPVDLYFHFQALDSAFAERLNWFFVEGMIPTQILRDLTRLSPSTKERIKTLVEKTYSGKERRSHTLLNLYRNRGATQLHFSQLDVNFFKLFTIPGTAAYGYWFYQERPVKFLSEIEKLSDRKAVLAFISDTLIHQPLVDLVNEDSILFKFLKEESNLRELFAQKNGALILKSMLSGHPSTIAILTTQMKAGAVGFEMKMALKYESIEKAITGFHQALLEHGRSLSDTQWALAEDLFKHSSEIPAINRLLRKERLHIQKWLENMRFKPDSGDHQAHFDKTSLECIRALTQNPVPSSWKDLFEKFKLDHLQ